MRRVPDAWRSAGARAREDCRLARTARPLQSAAAEIRRCGICDRARNGARGAGGVAADYGRAAVCGRVCELSAMARGNAAGATSFAGGLFGVEPRLALRPGGDRR